MRHRQFGVRIGGSKRSIIMADDLVRAGVQVFDIGVADETTGFGDGVGRNSGHFSDPAVEFFGGVALQRRAGERER